MSFDFLPAELEAIIYEYKDSAEKFDEHLQELNHVFIERDVSYNCGWNSGETWELWCMHQYEHVEIISVIEEHPNLHLGGQWTYDYQIVDEIYADDEDL